MQFMWNNVFNIITYNIFQPGKGEKKITDRLISHTHTLHTTRFFVFTYCKLIQICVRYCKRFVSVKAELSFELRDNVFCVQMSAEGDMDGLENGAGPTEGLMDESAAGADDAVSSNF